MRTAHRVNLVLIAGLLAWCAWIWPDLPARIPVHFAFDGTPDRWADRSWLAWFGLPLLLIPLSLLMFGAVRLGGRFPALLNIPNKKAYLRLSPVGRATILGDLEDFIGWLNAGIVVLFWLIQICAWRTALGADSRPWILTTLAIALAGLPLLTIVGAVRIHRAVAERERRERAGGEAHPRAEAGR